MQKKLAQVLVVFLLAFVTMLSARGTATLSAQGASIYLKSGTINPGQGESPDIPPGLTVSEYAAGVRGYYIVQFAGPVQQDWKDAVTGEGAELIDYIPDFAFKARMNPAQAARIEELGSVSWMGIFQPAYKLSPDLDLDGTNVYRVRVEKGAQTGLTTAAIVRSGAEVLDRDNNILLVAADAAQVEAIANVIDVAWVENFLIPEKHNEYGAGVIMGANSANANGYDGSSQIAAVADTGLGDGTAAGAHPGIDPSRIVDIFSWTTANARRCYNVIADGAQDVDSGHGTHVAVSVVGAGGTNGEGKGTAPAAGLVFQAVEEYLDIYGACTSPTTPDGYYLIGLPDDLHDLYQQAYDAGARIHSNSWGSSQAGVYTLDSSNSDDFIWDNPDMTITFSAGNAGIDANANGVVDDDSIGSPATAKNVITVGASENDRGGNYNCDTNLSYTSHDAYQPNETCNSMGGQNLLGTYGQRWGSNYPVPPLFGDLTAGNANQMASFSSRGPTDDGRIKPDVVAPGTWVLSGYSGLYQEGYGDPINSLIGVYQSDGWGMPQNEQYKYFGGTSMSNPLTAGAATVVRDFYQKAHGHNASAALTKATLINSAVDLLDENNDGANDNDFPIPNVHEGWGRVNLTNATDGSHQFVDEAAGLNTGGSASYAFDVTSSGPFKVSLVWSDYASTETASMNLVNDLDLTVTAPNGTAVYRGNVFSGGWTQTGGSADRVNNVENVYIQSAAVGSWTVTVTGFNVPFGAQPFALVVDGGTTAPVDAPPSGAIVSPANGSTVAGTEVAVQISATDAEDAVGTLTVDWNVDGGNWQPAVFNSGSGLYEASWDTKAVGDGSHTLNARFTDSNGGTGNDSNQVTVDNIPSVDLHVGDLDASTSTGKGGKWNATVTITVQDAAEGPVANATVSVSWSSGASGSDSCTTNAAGQCSVTNSNISRNSASASLTVDTITAVGYTYNAGSNHDPDGDSNGTTITVAKP